MLDTTAIQLQLEVGLVQVTSDLDTIATFNTLTSDWVAIPDAQELQEADMNSEADAVEEWNERRATLSQLEVTYQNTKRALAKIALGTFGTCEICQASIEEDRLSFLPTARTCKAHRDDEGTLSL
jgi:RNA polymerase-binding transcription factor DksA